MSLKPKFVWARLPDVSARVLWPVKVIQLPLVFCKCDVAWIHLKEGAVIDEFPNDIDKWKSAALRYLKKKPATLEAFLSDIEWALAALHSLADEQEEPAETLGQTAVQSVDPAEGEGRTEDVGQAAVQSVYPEEEGEGQTEDVSQAAVQSLDPAEGEGRTEDVSQVAVQSVDPAEGEGRTEEVSQTAVQSVYPEEGKGQTEDVGQAAVQLVDPEEGEGRTKDVSQAAVQSLDPAEGEGRTEDVGQAAVQLVDPEEGEGRTEDVGQAAVQLVDPEEGEGRTEDVSQAALQSLDPAEGEGRTEDVGQAAVQLVDPEEGEGRTEDVSQAAVQSLDPAEGEGRTEDVSQAAVQPVDPAEGERWTEDVSQAAVQSADPEEGGGLTGDVAQGAVQSVDPAEGEGRTEDVSQAAVQSVDPAEGEGQTEDVSQAAVQSADPKEGEGWTGDVAQTAVQSVDSAEGEGQTEDASQVAIQSVDSAEGEGRTEDVSHAAVQSVDPVEVKGWAEDISQSIDPAEVEGRTEDVSQDVQALNPEDSKQTAEQPVDPTEKEVLAEDVSQATKQPVDQTEGDGWTEHVNQIHIYIEDQSVDQAKEMDVEQAAQQPVESIEEDDMKHKILSNSAEAPVRKKVMVISDSDTDSGHMDSINNFKATVIPDSDNDSEQSEVLPMLNPRKRTKLTCPVRKRVMVISDSDTDSGHMDSISNFKATVIPDSDNDSEQSEVLPMLNPRKRMKLTCPDSDLEEDCRANDNAIARDISNKDIFVTLVQKCAFSKTGKHKITDRVYNSRHPCPFCEKTVSNFSHHIFSKKHEKEDTILQIKKVENEKERKHLIGRLRLKAAHTRNLQVLKDKKGEMHLLRRSNSNDESSEDEDEKDEEWGANKTVNITRYGPCPNCFGWVLLKSLKRHMRSCSSDNPTSGSNSSLVLQSDLLAGKIPEEASQSLTKEVFPIMRNDKISAVAKEDKLIINLGNQWMMRNRGNEIMRKYYTSSVMRLAAKLKLACQNISKTNGDLDGYFAPKNFNIVVKAAMFCCHVGEMDDEDLKAPSNAIKLGHDIKRMLSAKLATAIMVGDDTRKKEAEEFLRLMEIQWGLRVTKLARSLLTERSFNQVNKLPLPTDVKKLSDYLQREISSLNLDDTSFTNFRKAAVLTLVRVTLFNRRRCHEVQAMRLTTYAKRKTGVDEVGQEIRGDLTKFECHLLLRQEVVIIRGKTGRGVPVILPSDATHAMGFLADPEVRKKAGIQRDNPYVFANNGAGVFRAYDSIREVSRLPEAGLQMPELVRTSNMRKYMATMLQALNTTEAERQWVIDHLGHTMNVHRIHYRQTSDVLERVDVAKILLIQDLGLVGKYRGKRLQDIQIDEMLEDALPDTGETELADELPDTEETASTSASDMGTADFAASSVLNSCEVENSDEDYIPDLNDDMEEDPPEEAEDFPAETRKRKKPVPSARKKWSEKEVEELMDLFKEDFETNTLPGQRRIEKMMRQSMSNRGVIYKRKRDTIKKKLSNMMIRRRADI